LEPGTHVAEDGTPIERCPDCDRRGTGRRVRPGWTFGPVARAGVRPARRFPEPGGAVPRPSHGDGTRGGQLREPPVPADGQPRREEGQEHPVGSDDTHRYGGPRLHELRAGWIRRALSHVPVPGGGSQLEVPVPLQRLPGGSFIPPALPAAAGGPAGDGRPGLALRPRGDRGVFHLDLQPGSPADDRRRLLEPLDLPGPPRPLRLRHGATSPERLPGPWMAVGPLRPGGPGASRGMERIRVQCRAGRLPAGCEDGADQEAGRQGCRRHGMRRGPDDPALRARRGAAPDGRLVRGEVPGEERGQGKHRRAAARVRVELRMVPDRPGPGARRGLLAPGSGGRRAGATSGPPGGVACASPVDGT
jgi:hypothetical protein